MSRYWPLGHRVSPATHHQSVRPSSLRSTRGPRGGPSIKILRILSMEGTKGLYGLALLGVHLIDMSARSVGVASANRSASSWTGRDVPGTICRSVPSITDVPSITEGYILINEGVLDPWVAQWVEANPLRATPFDDLSPEFLKLARSPVGEPPTREIDHINDEFVGDIPVRIYRNDAEPSGLVVYFHGGGFVIGSIGLMDNVARELTHVSGAV